MKKSLSLIILAGSITGCTSMRDRGEFVPTAADFIQNAYFPEVCLAKPEPKKDFVASEKKLTVPQSEASLTAKVGDEILFHSHYLGLKTYRVKRQEQIKFTYLLITSSEKLQPTDSFSEATVSGRQYVCSNRCLLTDPFGSPLSYICLAGDIQKRVFNEISWRPNLIRINVPLAEPLEMESTEFKYSGSNPHQVSVFLDSATSEQALVMIKQTFNERSENKIQKIASSDLPFTLQLQGIGLRFDSIKEGSIGYRVVTSSDSPSYASSQVDCALGSELKKGLTAELCLNSGGFPATR